MAAQVLVCACTGTKHKWIRAAGNVELLQFHRSQSLSKCERSDEIFCCTKAVNTTDWKTVFTFILLYTVVDLLLELAISQRFSLKLKIKAHQLYQNFVGEIHQNFVGKFWMYILKNIINIPFGEINYLKLNS